MRVAKYFLIAMLCFNLLQVSAQYTSWVNPFIGTGGHGHTYPGATMPFGMVQLSPDTRLEGWDACSGYHYSDTIIYGFSHTHLSGTGVADYCDILLTPTIGDRNYTNMLDNNPATGYASSFDHETEKATPGYYAVTLKDHKLPVELTATARVGFHQYHFPDGKSSNVILDLRHRDLLLDGSYIRIVGNNKVEGLRRSSSWAADQWLYFAIEFSQPFESSEILDDVQTKVIQQTGAHYGTSLYAGFTFHTKSKEPLLVKVALSPVSVDGAWRNMETELPHWNFEQVKNEADAAWNKELSKIDVTTKNKDQKIIFYTALYHCMLAPNIYMDTDRRYRGMDGQIYQANGFDYYTVFSLWDTFRALHPLFTIIDQKRTNDFIQTFIKQYEQGGSLPVWELAGNETNCMIGIHSVSVIADAAVKGIMGYDVDKAYQAMKAATTTNENGWRQYRDFGMIESHDASESVSRTLEYAYNDWCIAMMGKTLGRDDYFTYYRRSQHWINLFDGTFLRPRANGYWYQPFDPYEVNFNYTEANAFQYNFFAPHDLGDLLPQQTLKDLEHSQKRLDMLFEASSETTGREQADITGLIGQYAHGNEPSHHIAYLYNFVQQPAKTQKYVHQIRDLFYTNSPDGLIGNEDCGQMSAWYVLSALGFYPVCPGDPSYSIGTPLFPEAKIRLENGNTFSLKANQINNDNIYIDNAYLNESQLTYPRLWHHSIMQGGTLTFNMHDQPNTQLKGDTTSSRIRYMAQPPLIEVSSSLFSDSVIVQLFAFDSTDILIYQTHGDVPLIKPITYKAPLVFKDDVMVRAIAKSKTGSAGYISTAVLKKIPANYTVTYNTTYDNQYTGGGGYGLIDGMRGGKDFRMGKWQGWQGKDMQVLLDLGSVQEISGAGAGFLQDIKSWIWMPKTLEVFVSEDGVHFETGSLVRNTINDNNYDAGLKQDLEVQFKEPVKARYIMFTARNYGVIPNWHLGAGGNAWIFCDEIWVK